MFRWPIIVGTVAGISVGVLILAFTESHRQPKTLPTGPILSECDGHLRELVIHYDPSAKEMVATVYRKFLPLLAEDITVHVVCQDRAAFDELASIVGPVRCRLAPILVQHPITTWSRDRWVALLPATPVGPTTLWSPRGEAAEEIWPARAGDELVGNDIAAALAPTVAAQRSELYFDSGDFLADDKTVFAMPRLLRRNIQHTVHNREEFVAKLTSALKRRVVLLDEAPDHHAGMFITSVGNQTMLVGDPSLGKSLLPAERMQDDLLPDGADFRAETQRLFDAVAAECTAAGYKVIRIPVVPSMDGRTYLTYCNVLIDRQPGRQTVYLPHYRGVEALNDAARAVWQQLGYNVQPVDCTAVYRHFGCLHCLVNVLRRS